LRLSLLEPRWVAAFIIDFRLCRSAGTRYSEESSLAPQRVAATITFPGKTCLSRAGRGVASVADKTSSDPSRRRSRFPRFGYGGDERAAIITPVFRARRNSSSSTHPLSISLIHGNGNVPFSSRIRPEPRSPARYDASCERLSFLERLAGILRRRPWPSPAMREKSSTVTGKSRAELVGQNR